MIDNSENRIWISFENFEKTWQNISLWMYYIVIDSQDIIVVQLTLDQAKQTCNFLGPLY